VYLVISVVYIVNPYYYYHYYHYYILISSSLPCNEQYWILNTLRWVFYVLVCKDESCNNFHSQDCTSFYLCLEKLIKLFWHKTGHKPSSSFNFSVFRFLLLPTFNLWQWLWLNSKKIKPTQTENDIFTIKHPPFHKMVLLSRWCQANYCNNALHECIERASHYAYYLHHKNKQTTTYVGKT